MTTQQDELREELEKAGLYDVLCSIHESHEGDDCFCTSEIAPFYRQLLALLQSKINEAEIRARIDERESMKFFDDNGKEIFKPYLQYRFTGEGLRQSWDGRTKELLAQLNQSNKKEIARKTIKALDYTDPEWGFSDQSNFSNFLHQQSPEIAVGVDKLAEKVNG